MCWEGGGNAFHYSKLNQDCFSGCPISAHTHNEEKALLLRRTPWKSISLMKSAAGNHCLPLEETREAI